MYRTQLQDHDKEELIDKILEQDKEIERLKKELRKYKNPNTPPSAHPFLKPQMAVKTTKRHRGALFDHVGTNRPKNKADYHIHIKAKECPNCHGTNIRVVDQHHNQVEEIPEDIKPKSVDVARDVCVCDDCNIQFLARDGRTPIQGKFGLNLMVLVIFLRFIVRGVLRKTAGFLETGFALKITPATVKAIVERTAKAGEAEYEALKQKIRTAQVLNIDETSFRVMGCNWWVWAFRSDTDLLLVIRKSRGRDVLLEILGEDYGGTIVCDCWRAYNFLPESRLQRCWAHLLRKSKELESIVGRHFHKKLSALFDKIAKFNKVERTAEQRERRFRQLTKSLKGITAYYARYEDCEEVVKYLDNHIESWFTCIRSAGIQPTNNYAEQAVRETVIVRKIIGAFRSIEGTTTYETIASLLATWQIQKKDLKAELCRMLAANCC